MVTEKIWEKAGVKVLRDLTLKSVNFSALATSDIKVSLFFVEMGKRTKLVRLMKEKNHHHRRKTQENDTF